MIGPIYRKISALLKPFSQRSYICVVFFLASVILLAGVTQSIKTIVFFFVIVGLILWIKLRNLFLSYSLVALFSLPFFLPGKYYTVLALPGFYIKELAFKEGVFLDYGVGAKDVFIVFSTLLFIREIIRSSKAREMIRSLSWAFKVTYISGLVFFLLASYVNYFYSPFFFLSEIWLIQYCFCYLLSIIIFYIYYVYPKQFNLVIFTFLCSGLLQFFLAIWQFFIQGFIGLPFEVARGTSFGTGLDENNSLFRVHGSTVYHNQLGLISLFFFIVSFPYFLNKKNTLMSLLSSLSLITIVLTQSRSIWLVTIITLFFIQKKYKKNVVYFIDKVGRTRFAFYAIGFTILLSFVFLPRLLLINNFFYKGGGGFVRLMLIEEGLQALSYNMLLGYGVGTNHVVLYSFFPNGVITIFPATIHVALIQFALEVGLIGTLLFIAPFFRLFRRNIIEKNTNYYSNVFMYSLISFFIFYLFLPHNGTIEFSYLGVILGFGQIGIYQKISGGQDENT